MSEGTSGGDSPTITLVGKSGMPWNSGQWINGDSNRMSQYTALVGHEPDAVTQSMSVGPGTWANLAGAISDVVVDEEFNRTPTQWVSTAPSFEGVTNFKKQFGGREQFNGYFYDLPLQKLKYFLYLMYKMIK